MSQTEENFRKWVNDPKNTPGQIMIMRTFYFLVGCFGILVSPLAIGVAIFTRGTLHGVVSEWFDLVAIVFRTAFIK